MCNFFHGNTKTIDNWMILNGHYDKVKNNPVVFSLFWTCKVCFLIPIPSIPIVKIHIWCPVRTIEDWGMPSTLYVNRWLKIEPLFTMHHHSHLCTFIWTFRWARLTEISNQKHDKAVCQLVQLSLWDFCWKLLNCVFLFQRGNDIFPY